MPAEPPFRRRGVGLMVYSVAIAVGLPACTDAVPTGRPPAERAEPGFAAQAAAVRRGESDQIRLDHTPVDDQTLHALDGLQDKLRRINLSHSNITDAGLAQIVEMRKLIQLRLASDRLTDAGLECLVKLSELRHLHLIDAPITDAGLEWLHALKNLESLYLDGTRATDDGIGRLADGLPEVHLHIDGGHHRADSHATD